MGFTFGLGAITADTIYVACMSFGLLALITALPLWGKGTLSIVGGLLLTYLGIVGIMTPPPPPPDLPDESEAVPDRPRRPWSDYLHSYATGVFLTASSPSSYGFWIAVSFPLTQQMPSLQQSWGPVFLAAGVGTAIAIWITFAITISSGVYRRLKPKVIQRVEQVLGATLLVFAALAFIEGGRMLAGREITLDGHALPNVIFGNGHDTTETLTADPETTPTEVRPPAIEVPIVTDPGTTTGTLHLDRIEVLPTTLLSTMTNVQINAQPWHPYGTDLSPIVPSR